MRRPHIHLVGCLIFGGVFLGAVFSAHAGKPVCGDGVAKGKEQCDGGDLRGETCESLGYAPGALGCYPDCTFDLIGCVGGEAVCGDGVVGGVEECDGVADDLCPGLCSTHCACPSAAPGDLRVHAIDVGQGDAILVISPDGFVMLFDAGQEGKFADVSAYLASLGIADLDYTLVSHMHADHVGAMDLALGQYPGVVACFDHGGSYGSNEYDEYDAAAGARRTTLEAGGAIDLGPSMTAEVLHGHNADSNENNNSVVVRLTYGAVTLLLGGDCEGDCEAEFAPGDIDVYKVHHHGSTTASSEGLIDAMGPYTALISVGADNAYGHPAIETLDRLAAHEATVYRTDLDGDLAVVADGSAYTVNGEPVCLEAETRTCGETDVGVCEYGYQPCTNGMWGICTGAVFPAVEDCINGLDDDCDGLTDGDDSDCAQPADHVVIAQVAYDTPGDDTVEEFVELYNPTGAAVSLDGWSLADPSSTWYLPGGTSVAPDSYLCIARNASGFQALYAKVPDVSGLALALNNDGDQLTLADPAGPVDYVAWEEPVGGWPISASTGDSIERTDPTVDSDTVDDFQVTSPAQPRGGIESTCGNGVCGAGEDCLSCPGDCPGKRNGKPSSRYCCGNGVCEPWGEDSANCPLDC